MTSTSKWDGAVVVEMRLADGSRRRLLIEDELDAAIHPDQAASLRARSADRRPFHAMVDTEAVVAELRHQAEETRGEPARRLAWRAEALEADAARSAPDMRRARALARARGDGHPSVLPYLRPA